MKAGGVKCKFAGNVEVDETFIGGKARNMHAGQRKVKGTGVVGKAAVLGLLERTTEVRASRIACKVVPNVRKYELQSHVRKHVETGSQLHTDAPKSVFRKTS